MNIWNKVLLGVLIVLSLVCIYLAAAVIRVQGKHRVQAQRLEAGIEQEEQKKQTLLEGAPGRNGIRQVRSELRKILIPRGRVWQVGSAVEPAPVPDAEPASPEAFWRVQVEPESGSASIAFDAPAGFDPQQNQVLFLFEQRTASQTTGQPGALPGEPATQPDTVAGEPEPQPQFLGEFKLPTPDRAPGDLQDGQVALESVLSMSEPQLQRLNESQGPWLLYEVVPPDDHEMLAEFSEEELRARLPAETVDEYLKDGKQGSATDDPDRLEEGNYIRRLRDYGSLFHVLDRRRTTLVDVIAATRKDLDLLNESIEGAEQQIAFRNVEIDAAGKELADLEKQRDAVKAFHDQLAAQLEQVRGTIQKTLESNRQLATELVERSNAALRQAVNPPQPLGGKE